MHSNDFYQEIKKKKFFLIFPCIAIHGYEKKKKVEKNFLIKIIKLHKFDKNFDENFFSWPPPPRVNYYPPILWVAQIRPLNFL